VRKSKRKREEEKERERKREERERKRKRESERDEERERKREREEERERGREREREREIEQYFHQVTMGARDFVSWEGKRKKISCVFLKIYVRCNSNLWACFTSTIFSVRNKLLRLTFERQ
jgi:hypothetical protein